MAYGNPALRMLALGGGIAFAMLLQACGGGGSGEPPWAAATMVDGSTYRMDYQLDAARRIASYEMRDESSGRRVQWCTGDLHGSWECRYERYGPYGTISATVDEQDRPVSYASHWEAPWGEAIAYSHDADGRLIVVQRNQFYYGDIITRTSTLEYDAAGHLAVIRLRAYSVKSPPYRADSTYTVLSPGAAPTRVTMTMAGYFRSGDFTIQLTDDGTGRYTQRVVNEVIGGAERIESKQSYGIDSRGYVTSQVSEMYQYEPGLTPVIRTEATWRLDWLTGRSFALASEGQSPSPTLYHSIAYPAGRMPSAPLTAFPAYSAASALDLLCIIAAECVEPSRMVSHLW